MKKSIGGFFELAIAGGDTLYHDNAIKLSTGRACLNLIIENKNIKRVYLPFYSCNTLIDPLLVNNIPFEFYSINTALEIEDSINLKEGEAIIYCNFYGIKDSYVNDLIRQYNSQLIIDNSHAFFVKGYKDAISFTTARKYFGVPDGAFLYMPKSNIYNDFPRNSDVSVNHLVNRMLGLQEKAFKEFQNYEASLTSKIQSVSILSEKILKTLDYNTIREKRNTNFQLYKDAFKSLNLIEIEKGVKDAFCYPLLLQQPIEKKMLHKLNIFIPTYWQDVVDRENSEDYKVETTLTNYLLPLPIDHRYDEKDITRVIESILNLLNNK